MRLRAKHHTVASRLASMSGSCCKRLQVTAQFEHCVPRLYNDAVAAVMLYRMANGIAPGGQLTTTTYVGECSAGTVDLQASSFCLASVFVALQLVVSIIAQWWHLPHAMVGSSSACCRSSHAVVLLAATKKHNEMSHSCPAHAMLGRIFMLLTK
jgi:hypothetical protein